MYMTRGMVGYKLYMCLEWVCVTPRVMSFPLFFWRGWATSYCLSCEGMDGRATKCFVYSMSRICLQGGGPLLVEWLVGPHVSSLWMGGKLKHVKCTAVEVRLFATTVFSGWEHFLPCKFQAGWVVKMSKLTY